MEFTIHSKNLQFLIINKFELSLQLEFIKLLKNLLSVIFLFLTSVLVLEKYFFFSAPHIKMYFESILVAFRVNTRYITILL